MTVLMQFWNCIHYHTNISFLGETFTVVWENVLLQDRPENGSFVFSATLNKSGDIVFAYKTIPIDIQQIYDDKHPVKVGLSDAYIIDKTIFRKFRV